MQAHLVQMDIQWEDRPVNLAAAERLIRQASPRRGDLVILPEMFDTGFSFNVERTADTDRVVAQWIERVAQDLGVVVHGSRTAWEGKGHKARNTAYVAGPGGVLCEYTKVHPFGFGGEAARFEGGAEVVTYQWADGETEVCVCPAICYDLRFPELFRRGLAMGAEVFVLGANWPAERAGHWRALLVARAIENQAYVLGVNRCGKDPRLSYGGGTVAIGPQGEVLGELGSKPGVLSALVDTQAVHSWRSVFPACRDIRL